MRIHSLLYPMVPAYASDLSAFSTWVFDVMPSPLVQNIVACLLVYLQAVYINRIVVKHRIASEITLFPGLVYVLLCSILPEYTYLSPVLIANTFVLMAVSDIFKIYKKPFVVEYIFNSGVFLAIATMIYFPYLLFWIAGFISLAIIRSFKLREMLQYASGLILPLFLYGTWSYYNRSLSENWSTLVSGKLGIVDNIIPSDTEGFITLGVVMLLVVIAVFSYNSYMMKKSIQVQKKVDILFWLAIFSLLSLIFSNELLRDHLLILSVPLSIFLSMNLIKVKNPLLAELGHLSVLILIGLLHFNVI